MMRALAIIAALLITVPITSTPAYASLQEQSAVAFDGEEAMRVSQAAIGRTLSDQILVNRSDADVRLSDYRGKPLLISLIYTSCYHSCSVFTRYLGEVVDVAREALGEGSFSVATIGFDAVNDHCVGAHDEAIAAGLVGPVEATAPVRQPRGNESQNR